MATMRLARPWPALLIVVVLVVAAGVVGVLAATAVSPAHAGGIAVREYTGPIDARAAAELPNGELVVVGASLTERARGIVARSDDGGQTWEVVLLNSAPLTGIVATGEAVVAIADCVSGDPCLVVISRDVADSVEG
jgi:photosystem II stability/assembly factor-like uncharacterized protein